MNWDYPLKPKQQTPHDPNPVPQKGRGEEEDAGRRKEQYQTCLVFFFLQQWHQEQMSGYRWGQKPPTEIRKEEGGAERIERPS